MSIRLKTIFTGFAPNLTFRDVLISLRFLLLPWNWDRIIKGKNPELAETQIKAYFNIGYCSVFDSGRSALYFALKALGIGEGDEVLVQAYTCMVVVNAIKRTGAKPIFVDIGQDFNLNPLELEKNISPRTKVLIIQHTFGKPAKINELKKITEGFGLKIIEDCAHAFGAKYDGRLVGTIGDIGLLSFGSDKVLSCVRGGALITNDQVLGQSLADLQQQLPEPAMKVTLQHLAHGPVFFKGKLLYGVYLGKLILVLARKYKLINRIIYAPEKQGLPVDFYPAKLANSLAEILLTQLAEVDRVNHHRKLIADYYQKNLRTDRLEQPWTGQLPAADEPIFLRYPILCKAPQELISYAKRRGVILGNWYDAVVAPNDIDPTKTDYIAGSCLLAEDFASRSVNLPTNRHISLRSAQKVVKIINNF